MSNKQWVLYFSLAALVGLVWFWFALSGAGTTTMGIVGGLSGILFSVVLAKFRSSNE